MQKKLLSFFFLSFSFLSNLKCPSPEESSESFFLDQDDLLLSQGIPKSYQELEKMIIEYAVETIGVRVETIVFYDPFLAQDSMVFSINGEHTKFCCNSQSLEEELFTIKALIEKSKNYKFDFLQADSTTWQVKVIEKSSNQTIKCWLLHNYPNHYIDFKETWAIIESIQEHEGRKIRDEAHSNGYHSVFQYINRN